VWRSLERARQCCLLDTLPLPARRLSLTGCSAPSRVTALPLPRPIHPLPQVFTYSMGGLFDQANRPLVTDGLAWYAFMAQPGTPLNNQLVPAVLQPPSPPPRPPPPTPPPTPPPAPPDGQPLVPGYPYNVYDPRRAQPPALLQLQRCAGLRARALAEAASWALTLPAPCTARPAPPRPRRYNTYCRTENITNYVYCVAGDGATWSQQFLPYWPTNLADKNIIRPGMPLVLRSNATGRFCRITTMTLTRQGMLCDQTVHTTATVFTYQAQGLAYNTSTGLRPLLADGLSWQMYAGNTGFTNLCIKPAPNAPAMAPLPPSPNNAPRFPSPPPLVNLPPGAPLVPNMPYNIRDLMYGGSYCRADNVLNFMICTNGTGGIMPEVFKVFHPFDMADPTLIQIGQPYVLQSMGTGLFCRSVTRSSTRSVACGLWPVGPRQGKRARL
jgi:hypothetical protein